ncbi:MAG: hypothetical protein C3F12_03790 [Candidatus Methylomirabilota bacterium]|nr:MAG: hypothetical protein C3F12_03790 [candidate division NC10 bacterium]
MSFITLNRKVHTWVGVVLAVFVTVIGVTGLVLVHKKDLASILRTTEVSGALIPSWYAREMAEKAREIKAVAVGTKELTESALLTGTKAGLMMQQESRWARAGGDLDGVEVTALLATDERWLAGTRWGLFQSLDRGRTWAPIKDGPLGGGKKLEVRTLQLSLLHPRSVWMGTQNGLYRSRDGGAHWEDVSAVLPIDEKSRHVVAIAFAPGHQETVLVGTHNGLYRYNQTSGEVSELGGKQLALLATAAIPRMALDKYLTDLHTGKLFADRLWLLYDITAIGFVLFVGTGLYLWIYPTLARRRRLRLQRGNGGRGCAAIALFLAVLHGGPALAQPAELDTLEQRQSLRLPEVVVDETAISERRRLVDPVPQAETSREEFTIRNNRRAGDVLQRMPGLYLEGPPGERNDVRLRGLDKEFTRIQVDGVQLPGGGEKREFQVNRIPSFMLDRIRIIRNPTAEFESDGLAGRIDIHTRPIPVEPTVEGRVGAGGRGDLDGEILNAALGFGYRPSSWFGIMGAFDYLDNAFERPKQKLFSTGKTEVEDDSEDQVSKNFNLDLGLFYGPGELHLKPLLLDLDKDKQKTKIVRDPSKASTKEQEEEVSSAQTWGIGLGHRHTFASGLTWETLVGYYLTEEDKDKDKLAFKESAGVFAVDKTTVESERKEDRTWNVSTSVAVPFVIGLRQELKFGGAFRSRDRFRDKDALEIDKAGKRKDTTKPKDKYDLLEDYFAAFIQDTVWLTDRISVLPGVRLEHVSLDSRAGDDTRGSRSVTDTNPSVHLLYRFRDDLSLRAAVSRAVNRPKFDELSPFEQDDGKKITVGNPNLDPAKSWNFDAGGEFATARLFLGVNLFYKRISDVIEEVDTGIDKEGKDVFRVQNVGDGWTRGAEIEQRLDLSVTGLDVLGGFMLWANQTFLESAVRDKSGRKRRFKDQPRVIANAGMDYTLASLGTTASIAWNHIGRRKEFKPEGGVRAIKPSSTVDVAVHQRVYKNVALFFEAENVTDEKRIEREKAADGTTSRKVEEAGRTFLLGLEWRF